MLFIKSHRSNVFKLNRLKHQWRMDCEFMFENSSLSNGLQNRKLLFYGLRTFWWKVALNEESAPNYFPIQYFISKTFLPFPSFFSRMNWINACFETSTFRFKWYDTLVRKNGYNISREFERGSTANIVRERERAGRVEQEERRFDGINLQSWSSGAIFVHKTIKVVNG